MWFTRWAMRQAQRERRPAVIYFHPWELDPTQPRLPGSWKSRFRHYRNLEKMEARLRTLMQDRTFVTMRQLLDQQKGSQSMPTFRPAEIGGGGRF
jgi:hypothetical protein